MGNDGLPLLLQQFNQPLLLRHQRVDFCRLAVEEGDDSILFGMRRQRNLNLEEFIRLKSPLFIANSVRYQPVNAWHGV
ncbi:hypothetical protein VY88_10115 [Azospirillum thiophilum]|nr:hypothetical protein VY88_10115 [Azospirillum thiophilum]